MSKIVNITITAPEDGGVFSFLEQMKEVAAKVREGGQIAHKYMHLGTAEHLFRLAQAIEGNGREMDISFKPLQGCGTPPPEEETDRGSERGVGKRSRGIH